MFIGKQAALKEHNILAGVKPPGIKRHRLEALKGRNARCDFNSPGFKPGKQVL